MVYMFQVGQERTRQKLNNSRISVGGDNNDNELNFDLGDCNFEADFDVPEVDLNVSEI